MKVSLLRVTGVFSGVSVCFEILMIVCISCIIAFLAVIKCFQRRLAWNFGLWKVIWMGLVSEIWLGIMFDGFRLSCNLCRLCHSRWFIRLYLCSGLMLWLPSVFICKVV